MTATSGEVAVKSGTDMKLDAGGALNAKSGMAMEIKSGMGLDLKASMGMNLKAGLALSAEGLSATLKAQTMGEVSAGAILTVKGTLVKVN